MADIRTRVERKEVVIGFGHPVYTVADPRNRVFVVYIDTYHLPDIWSGVDAGPARRAYLLRSLLADYAERFFQVPLGHGEGDVRAACASHSSWVVPSAGERTSAGASAGPSTMR